MKLEDYLNCIRNGEVPPNAPNEPAAFLSNNFDSRGTCTKHGMWPIVDLRWTKVLADWIETRKVLEVMAGGGWIAKAVHKHGVEIIATDNFSWAGVQHKEQPVFPVECLGAIEAVEKYCVAEVLLISWPPYESRDIIDVCKEWGTERPIIYIGEGYGGCNAPEEFFDHFKKIENAPSIPMQRWSGLNDCVEIGRWGKSAIAGR